MRKIRLDRKQVMLPNASTLGYGLYKAKPGNWIMWSDDGHTRIGRVIGRIAEADRVAGKPYDYCVGWLVVMRLYDDMDHAGINWVEPKKVTRCLEQPPHALLAWITGPEWVTTKEDGYRLIAMSEHGTTSEQFIHKRDNPDQAYNARPQYIDQLKLGEG